MNLLPFVVNSIQTVWRCWMNVSTVVNSNETLYLSCIKHNIVFPVLYNVSAKLTIYIYIVLDQLVRHIDLLSAMTQSYGMQLKKQELLTLIRSGEESIRLRSKPPGLGFFYIVSDRVLQSGWIYCSICDKLLNVESRMSSILSRHSRSKLHTRLLTISQERHAVRNTRTHMIINDALSPPIGEHQQTYVQSSRSFDNLDD